MTTPGLGRRAFLAAAGSCAAHVALALGVGPAAARALFAARPAWPVVGRAPWGRLERLADGVWALVSTPLAGGEDAMRTFSNGGIVAGRAGVLVVEGFASEAGARWMAAQATELAGRPPTHVVLTHHHGDHSVGLGGYDGRPLLVSTAATRVALRESVQRHGRGSEALAALSADGVELLDDPTTIDLGGRVARIVPRSGHTRSDLVVALDDPPVVWCGDLVWNGLFPNYVDARPSDLSRHVRALLEEPVRTWVPGHGSLADRRALETYVTLLDEVEIAARRAIEGGTPIETAAAAWRPPGALAEWTLFSPGYYAVAFGAWERELHGGTLGATGTRRRGRPRGERSSPTSAVSPAAAAARRAGSPRAGSTRARPACPAAPPR